MLRLNRALVVLSVLLVLLSGTSCATSGKASVESQRRGLLMLEGEHIYKNQGFYNSKENRKRHKKNVRAARRNHRRWKS